MKIDTDVLAVLRECTTEGNVLYLPNYQLDRKLYLAVNKVLEEIGGKWNRSQKGHVFDHDPEDDLQEAINMGEVTDRKTELQFFPTPKSIVYTMMSLVGELTDRDLHDENYIWLEPSVGDGNILGQFPQMSGAIAIDIDEKLLNETKQRYGESGIEYIQADFLEWNGEADFIVMNPPFTRQQDVQHVLHAWDCLKPGGVLVSVVSESPFFRETKLARAFRELLDEYDATVLDLPHGAFAESGTQVKTRIVGLAKGG